MSSDAYTSSEGLALSNVRWLDTHFEACRPEYEDMLRAVGIRRGWRVLDAGCGGGTHLPLLAGLVGEKGRVDAVDLAAENVDAVGGHPDLQDTPCPVSVRVGSLMALPYSDDNFDAVWCANTTQYFDDEGLLAALAELRRVARPGGTVAVKDVDVQMARFYPADSLLVVRLSEVSLLDRTDAQARGSVRGRELRRWLERAGLEGVWQRTTLIERWAPLKPAEREFFGSWMAYLARIAEERRVPEEDLAAWRALRDPEAPDHLVNHPEFYACEGQVIAVGRVPAGDET